MIALFWFLLLPAMFWLAFEVIDLGGAYGPFIWLPLIFAGIGMVWVALASLAQDEQVQQVRAWMRARRGRYWE